MAENREQHSAPAGQLSLDPVTVVRDILKRWYLIVVAAVIAGMAAYTASGLFYVPSYQTTTTFVVSARGSSTTVYQNLSATTNLASVFSEVLNSSILREAILEELGMDSFDGTISASAVPETNLLTLFGSIIGLGVGKLMQSFVIETVEVDIVMFGRTAPPYAYVLAAVLTAVFSVVVNIAAHFRLKKVDMVESLKTVE